MAAFGFENCFCISRQAGGVLCERSISELRQGNFMQRFIVSQFDGNTFIAIDQNEQREICVCSNYDDVEDDEDRVIKIVGLLNESNEKTLV